LWWHRELFFGWNTVGANVGGIRKSRQDPRTRETERDKHVQVQRWRKRRQRISCRLLKFPKLWIPLHVPSRPPFIGRRRDFYIPTIPLKSKNIPSVNAHTNVFYISYIYKLATSSHAKPGLFWDDNFDFASRWFVNALVRKFSCTVIPELVLHHIPEFRRFPKFVASQVQGFESSRIRNLGAQ
jgi:hypothetical protein